MQNRQRHEQIKCFYVLQFCLLEMIPMSSLIVNKCIFMSWIFNKFQLNKMYYCKTLNVLFCFCLCPCLRQWHILNVCFSVGSGGFIVCVPTAWISGLHFFKIYCHIANRIIHAGLSLSFCFSTWKSHPLCQPLFLSLAGAQTLLTVYKCMWDAVGGWFKQLLPQTCVWI